MFNESSSPPDSEMPDTRELQLLKELHDLATEYQFSDVTPEKAIKKFQEVIGLHLSECNPNLAAELLKWFESELIYELKFLIDGSNYPNTSLDCAILLSVIKTKESKPAKERMNKNLETYIQQSRELFDTLRELDIPFVFVRGASIVFASDSADTELGLEGLADFDILLHLTDPEKKRKLIDRLKKNSSIKILQYEDASTPLSHRIQENRIVSDGFIRLEISSKNPSTNQPEIVPVDIFIDGSYFFTELPKNFAPTLTPELKSDQIHIDSVTNKIYVLLGLGGLVPINNSPGDSGYKILGESELLKVIVSANKKYLELGGNSDHSEDNLFHEVTILTGLFQVVGYLLQHRESRLSLSDNEKQLGHEKSDEQHHKIMLKARTRALQSLAQWLSLAEGQQRINEWKSQVTKLLNSR